MKTLDFIQTTFSHNLKDPYSKALEPDCLSPLCFDYDTASRGRRILFFMVRACLRQAGVLSGLGALIR
jgi:hypothetical protein